MTARIIYFSNQNISFPAYLILDASVILEGFLPNVNNPCHQQAIDFLYKLRNKAINGETMALLPLLGYEECLFKIIKINIEANSISNDFWHRKYKIHPNLISSTQTIIDHFNKFLLSFPISIIEPEDMVDSSNLNLPKISEQMNKYIFEFNILPKDATIFSSASRLGIVDIASMDSDFSRANGFTIYLPQ